MRTSPTLMENVSLVRSHQGYSPRCRLGHYVQDLAGTCRRIGSYSNLDVSETGVAICWLALSLSRPGPSMEVSDHSHGRKSPSTRNSRTEGRLRYISSGAADMTSSQSCYAGLWTCSGVSDTNTKLSMCSVVRQDNNSIGSSVGELTHETTNLTAR